MHGLWDKLFARGPLKEAAGEKKAPPAPQAAPQDTSYIKREIERHTKPPDKIKMTEEFGLAPYPKAPPKKATPPKKGLAKAFPAR